MSGWVYIMTNRRNGTLYGGATADLARRTWEHREGVADGFTKRYRLKRLVYPERHPDVLAAVDEDICGVQIPVHKRDEVVLAGLDQVVG